jgi:hypothetical protein
MGKYILSSSQFVLGVKGKWKRKDGKENTGG